MAKTLKLAAGLSLPLDFVTKTAAILAQRRKGKTYAASVIAEEMVAAKQPFVALDPTGAWWGLRASADGTQAGLPVVILGGQHGDVKLERTAGRLVADLVVDQPGYYVIDFSLFESGEAERQFAVDFAERLYRAKGQPDKDFPLHLFVDEADRFVPQALRKGSNETSARLLGAFEAIIRRGGLRGIGTTLISQRAAVVNKNVLEMLDILFVLRTIGPNDQNAIDGYIKAHGTDVERTTMMGSLASLGIGEAWVWEPGAEPPLFQRVQIRTRRTFNSSATPKAGEAKRQEPRQLAAVDLEVLNTRMAETIERAKADDPKELRKQIARLETEIKRVNSLPTGEKFTTKVRDVPILTEADRELLRKLNDVGDALRRQWGNSAGMLASLLHPILNELVAGLVAETTKAAEKDAQKLEAAFERVGLKRIIEKLDLVTPVPVQRITQNPNREFAQNRPISARSENNPSKTGGAGRNVDSGSSDEMTPAMRGPLVVLANNQDGCTIGKLALLSGKRVSGGFRNILAALRTNGWMEGANTGVMTITTAGVKALGSLEELPTGDALARYWLGNSLITPAARDILHVLLNNPKGLDITTLAERVNKAVSGGFRNLLAELRTAGLIVGKNTETMRASEELFS